jgi:hypothetical protein
MGLQALTLAQVAESAEEHAVEVQRVLVQSLRRGNSCGHEGVPKGVDVFIPREMNGLEK